MPFKDETIANWNPARLAAFLRSILIDPTTLPSSLVLESLTTNTLTAESGTIGGKVRARGIDLEHGQDAENKIRWIRKSNGALVAEIESYESDTDTNLAAIRAVAPTAGGSSAAYVTAKDSSETPRGWSGAQSLLDNQGWGEVVGADASENRRARVNAIHHNTEDVTDVNMEAEDASGVTKAKVQLQSRTDTEPDQHFVQVEAYDNATDDGTMFSNVLLDANGKSDYVQLQFREGWRMQRVAIFHDPAALAATNTRVDTLTAPTGSVAVGDYIMFMGAEPAANPKMGIEVLPVANAADQIQVALYNADTSAYDDPQRLYHFLVINLT